MASSFLVVTSDLRRATVKVAVGAYMIDVLEEACSKLKLSSEVYQLKHNNKAINLTDPVRAAGLTQGARLELVVKSKSPSAVTVALRLPASEARLGLPNNRVAAKVRSDTSLWKLLRQLEEADDAKRKGLNITARGVPRTSHAGAAVGGSGQLYWETPVLKFAGRELASLDDFRKTLSQVGVDTGSQLITLEFRASDVPLQDAMERVQRQLEAADADAALDSAAAAATSAPASSQAAPAPTAADTPAENHTAGATTPSSAPSAAAQEPALPAEQQPAPPLQPSPQEQQQQQQQPPPQPPQPSSAARPQEGASHLWPVQVWSPPKSSAGMPAAAAARWGKESDAAAAPSIAQAKAHQRHLEEAGRNKRLKSDAELAEEARAREAKAAAVSKVDIRVRFPDGYTALWSLPNGATGAALHAAVRGVLADGIRHQPFRLVLPMARDEIHDHADTPKHDLVRGYGLRGGVVVNFLRGPNVPAPAPGRPYLTPEAVALAQDIVVPQPAADEEEEDERAAAAAASSRGQDGESATHKPDAVHKMAKFLRLSKK